MDLYQPISRKEIINTLTHKYGATDTARYYLNEALSDLRSMGIGYAENNPMLAAKHYEALYESLQNLAIVLNSDENKPELKASIK